MRSFFEDLGKRIGETTETVTNKAGEMVEIQRMKGQIRGLERENEADLLKIGRRIYESYLEGAAVDSQDAELCERIGNREESITKYQTQIEKVKGMMSCKSCGRAVKKEMKFCPYCGTSMMDTEWETEIREKTAETAEKVKEKTAETAEKVKEKTAETAEKVKEKTAETAEKVKEKTAEAAEKMKEKTTEAVDKVKEKTTEAVDKVKEKTAQTADKIKEKATEATEK